MTLNINTCKDYEDCRKIKWDNTRRLVNKEDRFDKIEMKQMT